VKKMVGLENFEAGTSEEGVSAASAREKLTLDDIAFGPVVLRVERVAAPDGDAGQARAAARVRELQVSLKRFG
jgi:hypothetical protein